MPAIPMSLSLLPAEFRIHALLSRFKKPSIDAKQIPPIELVYECAAQAFGTTVDNCRNGDRKRINVYARMLTANYIASNTKMSLSSIGKFLDHKDHATVLHARKKYADFIDIEDVDVTRATEVFLDLLIQHNPKYSTKNELYRI